MERLKEHCKTQTVVSCNSTLSLKEENNDLYTDLKDNSGKEFTFKLEENKIALSQKLEEMEQEAVFRAGWQHLIMVGEGGAGKTVAMLRCCRDLLEDRKAAIYIPFRKLNSEESVQSYIKEKVLRQEERAWALLETLRKGIGDAGSTVYLLVDGFNELREELRDKFMEELKELSANGTVKIIISSRRSMEAEGYYEFSGQRVTMQRLEWGKICTHLEKNNLEIPARKDMSEILGLPLMLRIYVAIQKEEKELNISKVQYLDWRKDMTSESNMLWNYIQCQIYNAYKREESLNKRLLIIAAEFMAPYLAARMNGQQGQYIVNVADAEDWIKEGLELFKESTEPRRLQRSALRHCSEKALNEDTPEKMLELLIKKLNLLEENNDGQISFEHQDFQDVLHLMYIENSLESYLEPFYQNAFTNVSLPLDVLNMMGECFSKEQAEKLWEAVKRENDGYGVRNIVEVWKRVKSYNFADMDFTGCDLQNTSLVDVLLSDEDSHALFCNSKIGRKTFDTDGHLAPITSVSWSPNGGRFVSGSYDSTLRLWNAENGECMKKLEGHTHYVRCVSWSPKEDFIVSGSDDRTLRIWNVAPDAREETCQILPGHAGWIYCVDWSCDGKRIASGDSEHELRIWKCGEEGDWESNILVGHKGRIKCVAWNPKKSRFCASSSSDRTVRIWDTDTGKVKILKGFEQEIIAIAWSEDGMILAVADREKVFLWNTEMILGTPKEGVWYWEKLGEHCINTLKVENSTISSIVWADHFIVTADSKMLCIWSIKPALENRDEKNRIAPTEQIHLDGIGGVVTSLAWSSHEQGLIGGADDSTVRLWKPHNPQWRSRWLCTKIFPGCSKSVRCTVWSPDSELLAAGYDDNMIRIWNMKTMKTAYCLKVLKGHTKRIKCIDWSLNGKWLVSGSNDGSVCIWDKTARKAKKRFFHDGAVNCAVWLKNGNRIISGSDDQTIRIWKWETEEKKVLHGHTDSVYSLAVDVQEKTMVSGSDDTSLRFWDLEKEEERKEKMILGEEKSGHSYPIRCVAWSPIKELNMVVSGSNDKTVKRWDAEKSVPWSYPATLAGHEDFVYCVAWSPDGAYLVSGSTDCTLWIWDARSGEKVIHLQKHKGYIWNVSWSPNGRYISSSSSDGTICIWDTRQLKDKKKVECVKELIAIPGIDITECDFTGASFEDEETKKKIIMNGGICKQ